MFNVGAGEVLVILVIALIVIGPQKLPGLARQIGRGLGKIRRLISSFQQEIQAAADLPIEAEARKSGSGANSDAPLRSGGDSSERTDESNPDRSNPPESPGGTTSGDEDKPE